MTGPEPRAPWTVPDDPGCAGPPVAAGFDSDTDGVADSVLEADGEDLLLHTDLGADGLADRTLRLRPDGTVGVEVPCADPPSLLELLLRLLRGH